jgi:rod shape-determining protein MreD
MLRFILYAFFFLVATILQTIVVPQIEVFGAQPSFMLILTVIVALKNGSLAGCFLGFLAGLLCDVYAPVEWLGAYSISYCITGFAVGQIEKSFINLNLFPKMIVLAIAALLKDAIYFFAIGKTSNEMTQAVIFISFPSMVYTVVLGIICFYFSSFKTKKKIEIYK